MGEEIEKRRGDERRRRKRRKKKKNTMARWPWWWLTAWESIVGANGGDNVASTRIKKKKRKIEVSSLYPRISGGWASATVMSWYGRPSKNFGNKCQWLGWSERKNKVGLSDLKIEDKQGLLSLAYSGKTSANGGPYEQGSEGKKNKVLT